MQTDERERSLSDFWRQDRSDDRVMELISVLRGANNLIGLMGSDLRAIWSGQDGMSYTDYVNHIVALDYSPVRDNGTPFPGAYVDEVIGYAAHEGGHCIWSSPGKDMVIRREVLRQYGRLPAALKRAWSRGEYEPVPDGQGGTVNPVLVEMCRIQNILEDAYIDYHVAFKWEVLGEHIRISRQRIAERRPIDLDAICRQARPSRNSAMNLWIAASLYGYPLPRRMSVRVRRAITALMDLSQKVIGEHNGGLRQEMALDAAIVLFKEFPTDDAPMPMMGQGEGGEGQAGDQNGQGQGTGAAGEGAGDDADEGEDGEGAAGAAGADDADDAEASGAGAGQGDGGDDPRQQAIKNLAAVLREAIKVQSGDESSADGDESPDDGDESPDDESSQQGGDGAGKVGNLDDFDNRDVVEVPQKLLEEIANAIIHEIEDLSESVAEVLAEPPEEVAASVKKADEDPELARKVTSQVQQQVQEIRRVFDRQQQVETRYLTGLNKGKLDSRRLARVGAGTFNVFQRRQVLERPDIAVGLLLDVSASMYGYMPVVEQTAAVFAEGLIRKPGVNFAAWTYTGGFAHVDLTRICDRRLGKLCLKNVAQGGGTPSGAAIAGVKLLIERMPERKRLIIHFTDGSPDADHHVVEAVRRCRQSGTRVYAIGVGRMGVGLDGQYGPGNWEVISTVADLPKAVARLIKRLDSFK